MSSCCLHNAWQAGPGGTCVNCVPTTISRRALYAPAAQVPTLSTRKLVVVAVAPPVVEDVQITVALQPESSGWLKGMDWGVKHVDAADPVAGVSWYVPPSAPL